MFVKEIKRLHDNKESLIEFYNNNQHRFEENKKKVINIGNNVEISINGLAQKIIAETGSKSEIVYVPYEEAYGDGFEDMERRVPNIDLIKELVGWKPKRDLSTIIADISTEMKKNSYRDVTPDRP